MLITREVVVKESSPTLSRESLESPNVSAHSSKLDIDVLTGA